MSMHGEAGQQSLMIAVLGRFPYSSSLSSP